MNDETPTNPDELKRRPRNQPNEEMSASLIFAELVRQAAARKAAENEDTPDIPPPKASLPQFYDEDDLPPEKPSSETRRPPIAPRPRPPVDTASNVKDAAPLTPPPPVPAVLPAQESGAAALPPLMPEPQVPAPAYTQAAARALTEEERRAAAALENERIRRIKKRQTVRHQRRVGVLGGVIRALLVVTFAAGLMATILSWFTSPDFLRPDMRRNLSVALFSDRPTVVPTIAPTPNWARTIGIVSGHRGPGQFASYDPGAVCEDGLRENDINFAVASKVVLALRQRGYSVLLLDEFDPRLEDFQAAALVSIHSNTCYNYDPPVSGFLVAKAAAKPAEGPDDQLANCIGTIYGQITGMYWRPGATEHMTDYHSFREVHPLTPGAILELGFMRADREKLTNQQDMLAQGITEGILCFLEPDNPFGILPATPVPATEAPTTDG
jgi:N-acetylmuramoyl-L-alanine amidase